MLKCLLGTSILYRPGAIEGGRIEHDCGTDRSISYFLEPMIALAPFSKKPFVLILQGITTDHVDPSVRIIATIRCIHHYSIDILLKKIGGYYSYSFITPIKEIWCGSKLGT